MFQRTDTVAKVDPELFAAIQAEDHRQQEHIATDLESIRRK